jgi:hypothetical protein
VGHILTKALKNAVHQTRYEAANLVRACSCSKAGDDHHGRWFQPPVQAMQEPIIVKNDIIVSTSDDSGIVRCMPARGRVIKELDEQLMSNLFKHDRTRKLIDRDGSKCGGILRLVTCHTQPCLSIWGRSIHQTPTIRCTIKLNNVK